MKRLFLLVLVGSLAQMGVFGQTFSTEFSAEMQKIDGKMETAPQLKGILEWPLGKGWSAEMEVASAEPGLDFRADAKRELSPALSLLAGASSGDACKVFFADLGIAAAWEKYECTAILHWAPFTGSQDKFLELTAQRNIGPLYIQPGLYVNHLSKDFSLTYVLTLGISLDIQ